MKYTSLINVMMPSDVISGSVNLMNARFNTTFTAMDSIPSWQPMYPSIVLAHLPQVMPLISNSAFLLAIWSNLTVPGQEYLK